MPVTTCRMVYEDKVEQTPVQVCKMVAYEETVNVPRVVEKRVPVTYTCRVPRVVEMRVPISPCGSAAPSCCGDAGVTYAPTPSVAAPTSTLLQPRPRRSRLRPSRRPRAAVRTRSPSKPSAERQPELNSNDAVPGPVDDGSSESSDASARRARPW